MAVLETIKKCMMDSKLVRNVCILAHVDHGKTTIADQLLAMNHIVSRRLAGSVRYLDDREDEQIRGITMKTSSVSLLWHMPSDPSPTLLNLVDTPGHIDFATEVAAAVRVCDGALIVVDIVEGVCVQTKEAIRQAFEEGNKMILIINKFDKLILELRKSMEQIFEDILRIIEDANAYIADLIRYEYASADKELDETEYLFSPDTGNVIFASAVHGWGFTLFCIADLFVDKLEGETVKSLAGKLWDFDNYIDRKTKTVVSGAILKRKENIFMQLCLKTVFHVYVTICRGMDRDKLEDIIKKLKVTATRDMYHSDPDIQIKSILHAWSPLADTIMIQCRFMVPPPSQISRRKIKYMVNTGSFCENAMQEILSEKTRLLLLECSPRQDDIVVYVSKMFCVNIKNISFDRSTQIEVRSTPRSEPLRYTPPELEQIRQSSIQAQENPGPSQEQVKKERFQIVALARVFSGTIRVGQSLNFLLSHFNPVTNTQVSTDEDDYQKYQNSFKEVIIKDLYILLGRELIVVDAVTAGNLCGIAGIENKVPRRGTLSNTMELFPFVERPIMEPIVHNSIEPVHPKDLNELRDGLHYLTQSDSCVQVKMQENGELVLLTAGDVHLAKCLEDLKKFTDVPVKLSEPMVALRETVVTPEKYDFRNDTSLVVTTDSPFTMSVLVLSMPKEILNFIQENHHLLYTIERHQEPSGIDVEFKRSFFDVDSTRVVLYPPEPKSFVNDRTISAIKSLQKQLSKAFQDCAWSELQNKIWSVGRNKTDINLLISDIPNYYRSIFLTVDETDSRTCFDHCIINAFNMFCRAGPLCGEPVKNCVFIIKNFQFTGAALRLNTQTSATIGVFTRNTFKEAFETSSPHLMEPLFVTEIEVNTSILGEYIY